MSRTQRLFELIQMLRRHRYPISGKRLAEELGISLRTLYRDIAVLQAQGASIEGEPGMGYVLRPGFMLPPLMLSQEEVEALVLGSRWVESRADKKLGIAATNVLGKISAVLPEKVYEQSEFSGLWIGHSRTPVKRDDEKEMLIRNAIRTEYKLHMTYTDVNGDISQRTIWPFALGFFEKVHIVVAWCELRLDFRHFRTDRILALAQLEIRYPKRRHTLFKKWCDIHGEQ